MTDPRLAKIWKDYFDEKEAVLKAMFLANWNSEGGKDGFYVTGSGYSSDLHEVVKDIPGKPNIGGMETLELTIEAGEDLHNIMRPGCGLHELVAVRRKLLSNLMELEVERLSKIRDSFDGFVSEKKERIRNYDGKHEVLWDPIPESFDDIVSMRNNGFENFFWPNAEFVRWRGIVSNPDAVSENECAIFLRLRNPMSMEWKTDEKEIHWPLPITFARVNGFYETFPEPRENDEISARVDEMIRNDYAFIPSERTVEISGKYDYGTLIRELEKITDEKFGVESGFSKKHSMVSFTFHNEN